MPKKSRPSTVTPDQLAAFFASTKDEPAIPMVVVQKKSKEEEKRAREISEIGCTKVRLWTKTVTILGWREKFKTVEVTTEFGISAYEWPFNVAFPFVNFEVLEDCGYLDRFGNGEEYVIDGKRYGVKDDVVWAGKRYLSSFERAKFGSFREFLKGKEFLLKKCVI